MKPSLFFIILLGACLSYPVLPDSSAQSGTNAPTPVPSPKATRNDQIYPATPDAKPFIDFDGSGFLIRGKRQYLASGSLHFARVPHELWRDRLIRMKNGGFNNVQTYIFWNYHEPREGEFNFSGDADLEGFLGEAQKLGMTATLRPGPYVCAEWESGGWPLWLRFKPKMNLRTDDPEFLKWNDHWYDTILPLAAKHEIQKGGNVILLQVENEHPLGWGTVGGDAYFDHLRAQVEKHKIAVPWWFSGLNHGGNPAPADIDPAKRHSPWMSTEFWAGWFDLYGGTTDKKLHAIDQANWDILSHGGGGHNFYMLHGGSNFDVWSDNSTGSSYDFGAAIGQAGDLRPSYYKMKRANLLAQSFPEILAQSSPAPVDAKTVLSGKIELRGARRGPEGTGTLLFLRNGTGATETAQLAGAGDVIMTRLSTEAYPLELTVAKDTVIRRSNLAILLRARHGKVTTVVLFGQPGQKGTISLSTGRDARLLGKSSGIESKLKDPKSPELSVAVPETSIASAELVVGESTLRILVIPRDLTMRTWMIGEEGKQWVVAGPAFVRSVDQEGDKPPVVTYERFQNQPSCGQVAVYGDTSWHFAAHADSALEALRAPVLGTWSSFAVRAQSRSEYKDDAWLSSEQPQQMGADGSTGAFAWYRARVEIPAAGAGEIHLKGADHLTVYVNGTKAQQMNNSTYRSEWVAGTNTIAVFVSQYGRNKGFNYMKPPSELDPKGILGDVTVSTGSTRIPVSGWRMKGEPVGDSSLWKNPGNFKDWKPLGKGRETNSSSGPTFYHSTFRYSPPGATGIHPVLRITWKGLSEGMIWVNGHSLGRYPERIHVNSLYIPEPWMHGGLNDVVILDHEGNPPSSVELLCENTSREVTRSGDQVPADTPFVVPPENPVRDLDKLNAKNAAYRAKASSFTPSGDAGHPENAVDGDNETVWRSKDALGKGKPDPWLAVDLGKTVPLGVVELVWDTNSNRSYVYTLDASTDGTTWQKIGDQTTAVPTSPDTVSELSRLNFHGEPWRYLRVTLHEGKVPAICELRVFPTGS